MRNLIIFIIIMSLFFYLTYKAIRFILPYMIPIIIFIGIYLFLSALLGSKKKISEKNVYHGEVIKDVEIRVVDESKESTPENSKANKET